MTREKQQRWLTTYLYKTGGSSGWGQSVTYATSAEEAAMKLENLIEEKADYRDPGLRVCVYGPIPDEPVLECWVVKKTETIPL